MATVVLFFPLLGGAHGSVSLSRLLEEYPERSAASSAATLLRSPDERSTGERGIVAFVLANDLAELGFRELAARELRPLLDSPALGGAAFLALARMLDEDGDDEALVADAKRARWKDLDDEEFAEAVFHLARACMRLHRYPEARAWLKQVPARSAYFVPSRYLLAQTEYALGRVPSSIDAIESVFRAPPREPATVWLQDRTAIFAGEMLTEIGLYSDAVAVLAWPGKSSPFRARAEREAAIARTLATVASSGDPDVASREATDVLGEQPLDVTTPQARARVAGDLERAWPSPSLRDARRRFTARVARRADDAEQGFGWRRAAEVVWRSFPPVILYEAARKQRRSATATGDVELGTDAGSFFVPTAEIAKLLTAIALASEAASEPRGECGPRALALRGARTLAASEPPPLRADLAALARSDAECDADPQQLLPSLRAKLDEAIEQEVRRREHALRSQRFLLEEGLAAARLERRAMLQAARGDMR